MRKILSLLVVIFLLTILPFPTTEKSMKTDHIVINEICYNVTWWASWIELYNPTNESINLSGYLLWFYSVNGPTHLPNIVINQGEYIVLCRNETKCREYWSMPDEVRVFEIRTFGLVWDKGWDSFSLSDGQVDSVEGVHDSCHIPQNAKNHSWARYKGGHDTDNFTNDFYDEKSPTPGYENRVGKQESTSQQEIPWNWIKMIAIASGVTICLSIAAICLSIYAARARRKR
jgi:hypothetical protein